MRSAVRVTEAPLTVPASIMSLPSAVVTDRRTFAGPTTDSPIVNPAVVLKAMPLGNVTHMTQAERDALGAWIRQGANIP